MAGIGFLLKKLFKKDDLSGAIQAYFHAIIATSGPWIFTVVALGTIYSLTKGWNYYGFVDEFRVINLYNFCFSLVFTAPIGIIATRYIADCIYKRDLRPASSMFIGLLITTLTAVSPFVIGFYLFWTSLSFSVKVLAIFEFYLISILWVSTVFISTLKHYKGLSIAFIVGMAVSTIAAVNLGGRYTTAGVLLGFSIGLMIIDAALIALILDEYPNYMKKPFQFLNYFKEHWELALGGLFYSLGIWVDKWVMWFSPEAVYIPSGFILYPYYDSAMFIAYLTVIPVMAMFMITQETAFFETYVKFYREINKGANYLQILRNRDDLIECIAVQGKNLVLLQACICVATLLFTPYLFQLIGMNFVQFGIFRYGVMGASFHILALLLMIILSYFEDRRGVLKIQFYFFASNALYTYIGMGMGFSFYGYGYFFSALTTFLFSAIRLRMFIEKLPFHAFVTTNASVLERKQPEEPLPTHPH